MILGSHNSLSYARPTKWWMRLLGFTAKCQTLSIKEQIDAGVRYFDIRVRWNKNERAFKPAHGPITFDCSIYDALGQIEMVFGYVRIILEQNGERKDQDVIDYNFKNFCREIEDRYPNIRYQYAVRKYDWKELYSFTNRKLLTVEDKYSSTTGLFWNKTGKFIDKIDDLWPWLYAKLHNRDIFVKADTDKQVLLIDFVELCNFDPKVRKYGTNQENKKAKEDTVATLNSVGEELFGV